MLERRFPASTPILVAREAELRRLEDALGRLPVALICGIGGVGKSTLAYAFAERWPGPRVYTRVAAEPLLVAVLDDVRRQLGGGSWPADASIDERLEALARDLDAEQILWVVDDIHRLDVDSQIGLVDGLARALRGGRALTTSREVLPRGAGGPDRFELRLSGLTEEQASRLWSRLDDLYGPAGGFDHAWRSSRGNPFLLRRAHAGGLYDDDPIAAAVGKLDASSRRLADALALSQIALARAWLVGLLPEAEALPVLRRLVTGLIVDIDGAGLCTLHDVYRESLLAQMPPEVERSLREALARLLREAELDPVSRALEVSRHLLALARHDEVGRYLLGQAPTLIRHGATGELVRCLDAIPSAHVGPAVRLARAQARCRLLDLRGGFAELEQLVAAGADPRAQIRLAFAKLAMSTGRLELAASVCAELVADAETPAALRLRARLFHALTRAFQGFGDEARRALAIDLAQEPDPLFRAFGFYIQAYTLWLEERDAEAERPMYLAQAAFAERTPTLHADASIPPLMAVLLARLGRLDEAEEVLCASESALRRSEDLRKLTNLRWTRANLLFERGRRADSLREFEEVRRVYERGGDLLGVLLTQVWIGRVLLTLGRRAEGFATLEATERAAERAGAGVFIAAAERSRSADLFVQLGAARTAHAPPRDRRGALARLHALRAIDEGRAGHEAQMRALLAVHEDLAGRPDHALDRALGLVAQAALHWAMGGDLAAEAALARAQQEADEGGVDRDVIPALARRICRLRLVTAGQHMVAPHAAEVLRAHEVVLDGRSHELRARGEIHLELSRKVMLRRLLYALAREPGRFFTKDELAAAQWGAPYDRSSREKPLWVNMCRLRALVRGAGLQVEVQEGGYALRVPPDFVFVEPLSLESSPSVARSRE